MYTINKTMRNKVLKNASKLITCDLNGEIWQSPDGYFATAFDIYDGYRVKKNQTVPEPRPDLSRVLRAGDYNIASTIITVKDGGYIDISGQNCDVTYRVNSEYYNFLTDIYPDALTYIDYSGNNKYAHIELKADDVLVAVIMPIKK